MVWQKMEFIITIFLKDFRLYGIDWNGPMPEDEDNQVDVPDTMQKSLFPVQSCPENIIGNTVMCFIPWIHKKHSSFLS